MELEEIIEDVKKNLSEFRFQHSMGVMKRCEELAKINGVDIETAKKVGIAHDIGKEMEKEESLQYVKDNHISIEEIERIRTGLLHAKIGADIAKKRYGYNEQMQKAICEHTTGSPDMDMLSKILYVADKTEENRNSEQYDIEYERKLADEDIHQAILLIIENNIKSNIEQKKLIEPVSILTRNQLMIEEENNKKQ